jgi:hypothetical protein
MLVIEVVTEPFDFSAYSSDGHLGLVVETKARRGANTEWARELRRNLLAQMPVASDAMFLLATPDALYLWKTGAAADDLATYEMIAGDIFKPYFERAGIDPTKAVNPVVFELVVATWLQDRTRGLGPTAELLEQAGLSQVLRGGRVVHQAAA